MLHIKNIQYKPLLYIIILIFFQLSVYLILILSYSNNPILNLLIVGSIMFILSNISIILIFIVMKAEKSIYIDNKKIILTTGYKRKRVIDIHELLVVKLIKPKIGYYKICFSGNNNYFADELWDFNKTQMKMIIEYLESNFDVKVIHENPTI